MLKGHKYTVNGVACFVGADGKPRIVSAGGLDKTVRVWNPLSGEEEAVYGMNEAARAICVCECPDAQDMVIVSQGRSTVTFDIQKEIGLPSASAPSSGASEALPPFPGTLTLPPVASQTSDEVLVGRSVVREGSSRARETSATSTLLGLVNEIKEAMGYSDDTKLATALADAASDLGIEMEMNGTAKSKANRIAEELGLESRC